MPNLLIADDHPLFRAALRGAAADAVAQLTVREAESLDGVIATLEAHDDIDLVLLDLHMRTAALKYKVLFHWTLYRCSAFCFGADAPCRQALRASTHQGGACVGSCRAIYLNASCGEPEAAPPPHYVAYLQRLCNSSSTNCSKARRAPEVVLARAFG